MKRSFTNIKYGDLYHAIENSANQNAGKLLYTRRYYTIVLVTLFCMTRYKMVMQHFLVVYHVISYESPVFSRCTQMTRGIRLESVA